MIKKNENITIDVADNPLHCTCKEAWILEKNITSFQNALCKNKNYTSLINLSKDEFFLPTPWFKEFWYLILIGAAFFIIATMLVKFYKDEFESIKPRN